MYLYSFLFCIICASANVIIKLLSFKTDTLILLLGVGFYSLLILHVFSIKSLYKYVDLIKTYKLNLLIINIAILGMYCCIYYGITLSNPFYLTITYFMTIGMISDIKYKAKNIFRKYLICVLFIILLIYSSFDKELYIGLALGVLGGIFGYINNYIAYKLCKEKHLSSNESLMVRFWLIFFVSLFLSSMFKTRELSIAVSNIEVLFPILIISIMSVILQQFFNNKGVIMSGVNMHGFIKSFTPITVFVCEILILHNSINYFYLAVGFAMPIIMIIGTDVLKNSLQSISRLYRKV